MMRKWTVLVMVLWLAACTTQPAREEPTQRNVILFVGDGMGISTVTAARILAGQLTGATGEEHDLAFDNFPNVALVKTYATDLQVGESASTMTAMITGEKTRASLISVSSQVKRGDCAASLEQPLTTLLEQAELAGFRTGIVSTAAITHATLAATYAHSADRSWEDDTDLPFEAWQKGCRDIARQFVEFDMGDGIEVALGGGRAHFLPVGLADSEYPDRAGVRADDRNLISEWLGRGENRSYVWNSQQFDAIDPSTPGQVLGLFETGHMQYEADRLEAGGNEPSLVEMTEFAINKLQGGEYGYFLVVEGARIDHAHHGNNAYRALTDTLALDAAVAKALAVTDPANTLILVTADHSHGFTISGYPRRGNPILGKVESEPGVYAHGSNGIPYTTLGYMNGPGYREELPDLTDVDTTAPDYLQVAGYPKSGGTHGGEDVAAYAHGLGAERLGGVIEQNLIYNVLYSALFGQPPQPGTSATAH